MLQAKGDADVDIATAAVSSSLTKTTTLIGEDTDLLVLLLYYCTTQPPGKRLYFRSDKNRSQCKVYDIPSIAKTLGPSTCVHLLFVHAFTGCDTTSRIHGLGKKSVFKKLVKDDAVLLEGAQNFCKPNQGIDKVMEIWEKVLVSLLGAKPGQSLNILRSVELKRKVISATSFVAPEQLPPTSAALKFHSQRTYLQIMTWMGQDDNMKSTEWGWALNYELRLLTPCMTDKIPAPQKLLKIIHCNCTSGCGTLRCSC